MKHNSITIRLSGGLGNQMFQYAFGRAIAEKRQASLILNCYGLKNRFKTITQRSYALGSFVLNQSVSVSDTPYSLNINRFAKFFPLIVKLLSINYEKNSSYDSFALNDKNSRTFEGYWQSHRYFENINDALLKEFRFRGTFSASFVEYEHEMKARPSVMLHVRRGDYVTLAQAASHHGILDVDYYKSAVAKVLIREPEARFFVFSDDMVWCRQALSFLPFETCFIKPDSNRCDVQELILMSLCRHHIIANSSFSWWSAWLANSNPNKKLGMTFAPRAWFSNQRIDQGSRFPDNWIVL